MNDRAIELRYIIAEKNHQLEHLKRSQDEIQLYLVDDPNDRDLLLAFSENMDVIKSRENEITHLKQQLRQVDPSYSGDDLRNNIYSESNPPPPVNAPFSDQDGVYL